MAGRDELLDVSRVRLERLQLGFPQRSIIYYGLRGVGKTVLLNTIEEVADNRGCLHYYTEVNESKEFKVRIVAILSKFMKELSIVEKVKDMTNRFKAVLSEVKTTYSLGDVSVTIESRDDYGFLTGNFETDLTDLFVMLGKILLKSENVACLFVDEIQNIEKEDFSAFCCALHRCNQLRMPIMFYGAGLPKVLSQSGVAKSYAERLFEFIEVDNLDELAAKEVITGSAQSYGVMFEDAAIQEIIDITEGHPYFLQQMCDTVWDSTNTSLITYQEVVMCKELFLKQLDKSFFAVRYERCSHKEKSFITAMVRCGELPCTISNVAKILNKSARSVSPLRAKLINKGMIYSTGHTEIDFTVPQFDKFIKRINPELEL